MHQPVPTYQSSQNVPSEKLPTSPLLSNPMSKSLSRAYREVLREQVNLGMGNRIISTIYVTENGASGMSEKVGYLAVNAETAKGGREKPVQVKPAITNISSPADDLIEQILSLHKRISNAKCLKPSPEINELFDSLVGIAIKIVPATITEKIMNDLHILAILPSLRSLCAQSECHLEAHWASRINASKAGDFESSFNELKAFPYFDNYVDLARMELHALRGIINAPTFPSRLVFIGSGPLPLTSLCILHALNSSSTPTTGTSTTTTGTCILNIDSNPVAIQQSSLLTERIGEWGRGMEFACEVAGAKGRDLTNYDIVFLAALVGSTQEEKEDILKAVVGKMRKGALLVVRTAHGLRRLLYTEFDYTTEVILACLDILTVVHPHNHIVNSIVIGKIR